MLFWKKGRGKPREAHDVRTYMIDTLGPYTPSYTSKAFQKKRKNLEPPLPWGRANASRVLFFRGCSLVPPAHGPPWTLANDSPRNPRLRFHERRCHRFRRSSRTGDQQMGRRRAERRRERAGRRRRERRGGAHEKSHPRREKKTTTERHWKNIGPSNKNRGNGIRMQVFLMVFGSRLVTSRQRSWKVACFGAWNMSALACGVSLTANQPRQEVGNISRGGWSIRTIAEKISTLIYGS